MPALLGRPAVNCYSNGLLFILFGIFKSSDKLTITAYSSAELAMHLLIERKVINLNQYQYTKTARF